MESFFNIRKMYRRRAFFISTCLLLVWIAMVMETFVFLCDYEIINNKSLVEAILFLILASMVYVLLIRKVSTFIRQKLYNRMLGDNLNVNNLG